MMKSEIINLLKKYEKIFGENFPVFQIFRGRDDNEIISIISECINQNKTAYELGYVELKEGLLY